MIQSNHIFPFLTIIFENEEKIHLLMQSKLKYRKLKGDKIEVIP